MNQGMQQGSYLSGSGQVGSYGLWEETGHDHEAQGEADGEGCQGNSVQQQHHPHHNQELKQNKFQRRKNPGCVVAMLPGKFPTIRKV